MFHFIILRLNFDKWGQNRSNIPFSISKRIEICPASHLSCKLNFDLVVRTSEFASCRLLGRQASRRYLAPKFIVVDRAWIHIIIQRPLGDGEADTSNWFVEDTQRRLIPDLVRPDVCNDYIDTLSLSCCLFSILEMTAFCVPSVCSWINYEEGECISVSPSIHLYRVSFWFAHKFKRRFLRSMKYFSIQSEWKDIVVLSFHNGLFTNTSNIFKTWVKDGSTSFQVLKKNIWTLFFTSDERLN